MKLSLFNKIKTSWPIFLTVLGLAVFFTLSGFFVYWQVGSLLGISSNSSQLEKFNFPKTYDKPLIIKLTDLAISIAPLRALPAQAQVEKNIVRYINAFTNTDIVQTKYTNKIKEDIILKQPGHPEIFEYQIDLTPYDFSKDSGGNLVFYEKGHSGDENYRRFSIPAPFLIDADGQKSSAQEVEFNLTNDGRLTLKPSAEWLGKAKYPVILDPTIEINILNVHSHPQQGENWIVDFTTQGTADLKIIPNDQATIDDDEFVSLTCGDKKFTPQILAGDVIFVPNWSCNGTGQVIHYTKKAGNHTLRFEILPAGEAGGGQTAYAYNSDSNPIIFRAGISATGGTITYTDSSGLNPRSSPPYAGGYTVHTFTTPGNSTFTVTGSGNVDYLVVAGGGGGGANIGGGGGAGGMRTGTLSVSPGNKTVTVGGGGNGGTGSDPGTAGSSSVFDSITSSGGGYGAGSYMDGGSGGSGGGAGGGNAGHVGGAGTSGQGNNGGNAVSGGPPDYYRGGGGGKGGAGTSGGTYPSGGSGESSSITGTAVTYATGGSGLWYQYNAPSNTGDGGGGGAAGSGPGGSGGSGIVIVRYLYSVGQSTIFRSGTAAFSATGGTITYTDSSGLNPRSSPAYAGGYTVHTFTTPGNSTFTVTGSGTVDVLTVAGGGAGGGCEGGNGGAGGYKYTTASAVSAGNITVTVGSGGSASGTWDGTDGHRGGAGGSSAFGAISVSGGGGGGGRNGGNCAAFDEMDGGSGGSGGGGADCPSGTSGDGGAGGSGTGGQGYAGGSGAHYVGSCGGGGGSAGAGQNGGSSDYSPGNGGGATANSISGTSVSYAAGGSGQSPSPGSGGANTGNGGQGGSWGVGGGAGGSGIVIVRYKPLAASSPIIFRGSNPPTGLSLSHSTRSKSFSVSWTAGSGNGGAGGCKLQFYTGSVWTDITSATSVNCDANSSSVSYNLNADGWKASWDGTQVRLVRNSDSSAQGTFSQTLACASTSGSGSSTPTIDEDCDGNWDNAVGYGCNWGCTESGYYTHIHNYNQAGCSAGLFYDSNMCNGGVQGWPLNTCLDGWVNPGWWTYLTLIDASCCTYGWTSTCYTYY